MSTKREREIYWKTFREVGMVGNEVVLRDIVVVQVDIYEREERRDGVAETRSIGRLYVSEK